MGITKKTVTNHATTVTELLAADADRQGIIFDNQSAADIYIAGTSDASSVTLGSGAKPGILLGSGKQQAFWAMDFQKNEWARLTTGVAWYGIQNSGGDVSLTIHTF